MASKFRPKGSYKDYLNLDLETINTISERELKAITTKLNDAANKRMKRLEESGLGEFSQAYRGRKKRGLSDFSLKDAKERRDIKMAYLEARNFLKPEATSTKTIARRYKSIIDVINKKGIEKGGEIDRRYKSPRLKKSALKEETSNFWREYDKWSEIQGAKGSKKKGDTNEEDVMRFAEEVYGMDEEEMEEQAESDYEESVSENEELEEEGYDDEEPEEAPTKPVPPSKSKRSRAKKPSHGKQPTKGGKTISKGKIKYGKTKREGSIKQRFEKVKIF